MASPQLPQTMKAWQFSVTGTTIENHLKLNSNVKLPTTKPDEHLVRVLATAFNPVDYKVAEVPYVSRLIIKTPATPGLDFVGRIVKPAAGSAFKEGELVFGVAGSNPLSGGGGLAEYAVAPVKNAAKVPTGVAPIDTATIGIAGLTAYQSIVPYTKAGSRVFINGGSGGTGIFGIQIAKAHGCYVAATCSTPNVELCKSLGADEVVDYKKGDVVEALKQQKPFDHIVDNVGSPDLFWRAHEYSQPSAKYVFVGGAPTLAFVSFFMKARLWPGFLGGGKRKYQGIFAVPDVGQLEQIANWMVEGKVKAVIDSKFAFDDAPDGIRKQKTGRARGKIVVDVALDDEK